VYTTISISLIRGNFKLSFVFDWVKSYLKEKDLSIDYFYLVIDLMKVLKL